MSHNPINPTTETSKAFQKLYSTDNQGVWKVTWVESERGWGQRYEDDYYKTKALAEDAIKRIEKSNEDDYKLTGRVPEWYMQARGKPTFVHISEVPKDYGSIIEE